LLGGGCFTKMQRRGALEVFVAKEYTL